MRCLLLAFGVICSCATRAPMDYKHSLTREGKEYLDCSSGEEFVTTSEFLRELDKGDKVKPEMIRLATRVSAGCTGSAERFITTSNLLINAGLDSKNALQLATEVALEGPEVTNSFQRVFKASFAKEYLDLDLGTSIRMARELSLDLEGNPGIVGDDFFELVFFCLDKEGLAQSKPKCTEFAAKIVRPNAERAEPVASLFKNFFAFVRDSDGPNLTTGAAIELAEKLVIASPRALIEFVNAYKYSSDTNGLALNRSQSLKTAERVAINARAPRFATDTAD